ncbi:nucleotidyltransferase family protein [Candidatus Sumerlaeota bacterium]|nr:nucleotidyltransferase family protein [Candidatus Sumerlaeota bacterium]
MLTQETITKALQKDRAYLSSTYGVARIGLFGSYANGTPTKESDVDLVVEFNRPIGLRFVEFAEYLERLLGANVDVLTPAGIQNIRNKRIAQSILKSIVYV